MPRRRLDLRQLLAGSGSVKSRDLRPALSERGRVHVRTEGGHHYYQHGRHKVSVPQRLKGKGTIEAVIKLAIAVEDESDDADKEADNESHP